MIDHEDRQLVAVPRWVMLECGGDARDAMVLAQITYWLQPPQRGDRPHRTTRTVDRDGHTWIYLTDAELAEDLGMSRAQVQRARTALVKRALIESKAGKVDGEKVTLIRPVIAGSREVEQYEATDEPSTLDPRANTRDSQSREHARSRARASSLGKETGQETEPPAADAAEELFPTPPGTPPPNDPVKDEAHAIAQVVWDGKNPKPAGAGAFMGLRSVAHALLTAGHARDVIVDGMLRASPVTIRAVEFAIGQAAPKARGYRPDAGIITDRDAPSGRIEL